MDKGGVVNEQARVIAGVTLGAVAGSLVAFFVFTERRREALRHVSPALDDVSRTLEEIRTVIDKAEAAVREAREAFTDVRTAFASHASADHRNSHVV
jgi:hypothetical protein